LRIYFDCGMVSMYSSVFFHSILFDLELFERMILARGHYFA